ncbi:hypothetical protein D9M68_483080 [compost metagenome]
MPATPLCFAGMAPNVGWMRLFSSTILAQPNRWKTLRVFHPTAMAAELRLGTVLVGASLLAIPNDPAIAVLQASMDDRQQAGSYRPTSDAANRANGR